MVDKDARAVINQSVIDAFRTNRGRVPPSAFGKHAPQDQGIPPILLLHHKGRVSGRTYVVPLAYSDHGKGRFAVRASNSGNPGVPQWYLNVLVDPEVEVEVGTDRFGGTVRTATGTELDDLIRSLETDPDLAALHARVRAKKSDPVPVLVIERQGLEP